MRSIPVKTLIQIGLVFWRLNGVSDKYRISSVIEEDI